MSNAVTICLIAADAATTSDRAPGFSEIPLSTDASAVYHQALERSRRLTLEDLATLVEAAARSAAPQIAMEIAGMASDVARELMRGRHCLAA
ncbi:MAG: hypothetical protein AAFN79_12475 [Pseudomonadota bacterium]